MVKGVTEPQCDCDQNKEVTDLPQYCSSWFTAWCLSENWLAVVHKEISTEIKSKCLETLITISHSCDIQECNQWTCLMELSIEQKYKSVKHWWGKPNGSFTCSLRSTALNLRLSKSRNAASFWTPQATQSLCWKSFLFRKSFLILEPQFSSLWLFSINPSSRVEPLSLPTVQLFKYRRTAFMCLWASLPQTKLTVILYSTWIPTSCVLITLLIFLLVARITFISPTY